MCDNDNEMPTEAKPKISKPSKVNAFYCFMQKRRPELEAAGNTFPGGMKDVANMVDAEWKVLPENSKEIYRRRALQRQEMDSGPLPSTEKYENMSTRPERNDNSEYTQFPSLYNFTIDPADKRRNNFGVSFNELKRQDMEITEHEAAHKMELKYVLKNGDPYKAIFIVTKFSCYVDDEASFFLPAEIGLTAFCIKDGIIDNFGTLIDVYEIPLGHGSTARKNRERLEVPQPPFDNRLQNYKTIISRLEGFIAKYAAKDGKLKVYSMPKDENETNGCFNWLYEQIGENCPIEVHRFTEAILMLSEIISDAQLTNDLDGRALQDRLTASRVYRDTMLMNQSSSSYQDEGDNNQNKRSRFERGTNNGGRGNVKNGRESNGRSTSTVYSAYKAEAGRPSSSLSKVSTSSLFTSFPYSASICSLSRTMCPPEMSTEDWMLARAGYFTHEQHVEEFLSSFDLAFEPELSCMYHMEPEGDFAMNLCPLNNTNRIAYNILDALLLCAGIVEPKLNYHIPSVGVDPESEVQRRETMLRRWVIIVKSDKDFKLDTKIPPPYFKQKNNVSRIPK